MTYTGGNSKRQVDVEFVYDAKATKPVYTFISENPMLHYVSGQSSQNNMTFYGLSLIPLFILLPADYMSVVHSIID